MSRGIICYANEKSSTVHRMSCPTRSLFNLHMRDIEYKSSEIRNQPKHVVTWLALNLNSLFTLAVRLVCMITSRGLVTVYRFRWAFYTSAACLANIVSHMSAPKSIDRKRMDNFYTSNSMSEFSVLQN